MPPADTKYFQIFIGTIAALTGGAFLLRHRFDDPELAARFILWWGAAIGCTLGLRFLAGKAWSLWCQPVMWRAAPDAAVEKLPAPGVPWPVGAALFALAAGLALTLGQLPFSRSAQLIAGFRTRHLSLPQAPGAPEDTRPADIYLVPLRSFPQGTASWLAAELRRSTGLLVATLPALACQDVTLDTARSQFEIEKLDAVLFAMAKTNAIPLPQPLPRPHTPLLLGLLAEDAFSLTNSRWNYVLCQGSTKVTAIACSARLHHALPVDDSLAAQTYGIRLKKLCLRLIGRHVFDRSDDAERHSVTGGTLQRPDDLDVLEDFLRPPLLIKKN